MAKARSAGFDSQVTTKIFFHIFPLLLFSFYEGLENNIIILIILNYEKSMGGLAQPKLVEAFPPVPHIKTQTQNQ